ncbi:hypothetical protein GALL_546270 [mine drainage metagenome]|uniref:Uncharacterized protein n=1 Tax=mine drainage metagenome TaxID=410659 RepID=A0A1J5P7Q9_9ZZZZ
MNKYTHSIPLFLKIYKLLGMLVLLVATGGAIVSANNQEPAGGVLHYTGSVTGSAAFNAINCTLRSGQLVGLGYYAFIGKSVGPNIALFSSNDDGTGQHLGFVPSGKSQQHFYYTAKASGTVPGLDTSQVSRTKTITFTHVLLQNRASSNDQLTLDGRLTCTTITE